MRSITAYPLSWPAGWPRCKNPSYSRFKAPSFASARDELIAELRRFGAKKVVLSTNIPLRNDGLPYANSRQPDDRGVAVYFQLNDQAMSFACDKWRSLDDNVVAISKTIAALRGIERWGSSDLMKRAFTGFAALPPSPARRTWWEVLGLTEGIRSLPPQAAANAISGRYRQLMMKHHPDRGGDPASAAAVNAAFDEAKKELGIS